MITEQSRIIELVREHLRHQPPDDFSIEVLEDQIRKDNDWWYVPVRPSRRLDRISHYYEVLAAVEEDIDAETGENVLLVPTLPEG